MSNGEMIPQSLQLTVDWSGSTDLPLLAANVFLVQQTPYEFILTFGAAVPPVIQTGGPNVPPSPAQIEQLRGTKIAPSPIVRLALAPGRVVELLQILQQQLALYQQQQPH